MRRVGANMATLPDDVDTLLCSSDACRCLGQVGRASTLSTSRLWISLRRRRWTNSCPPERRPETPGG
jgi:hypothetical protein